MSPSSTQKQSIFHQETSVFVAPDHQICNQCGGNGYMKTSPNCYHTCLNCVGRGFLKDNNQEKSVA